MATPIGGLTVYFEDDTSRFSSSMRANAALVEQQSQRIKSSLGGVAGSVDELNHKVRNFEPDAFRALSISALRAQNPIERLRTSLLAIGALAGGGFIGAFAVKTLTDTADRYTAIQNKVATVVEGSRQRVLIEQQIYEAANRSRTSFEATATLYQRMSLSSANLKANQADILQVAENVQKALTTGGATTAEAAGASVQLTQALGSGRLAGDELRSILENAPVLAQAIAKEFNVSVGELKAMGTEGTLVADRVFRAILNATGDIDDRFKTMRPTIGQALQVIDNAFTRYVGGVDQSLGASTALANGIVRLADNFHTFGDMITYAGGALAAFFVARSAGAAVDRFAVQPFMRQRGIANAAFDAAQLARTEAEAIAAAAQTNAKNAAYRTREFMDQPMYRQAAPAAQAEFERAATRVDQAQQKAAEATARHSALIEKRVALEQQTATVATTAANQVERARNALIGRETQLNDLIAKRADLERAVASAGGGAPSRANQQAFYNALAREVAGREALAGLRVERLDVRDALRTAREQAFTTAGTPQEAVHLKEIAAAEQRLAQIDQERSRALNQIYQADRAQQAANMQLQNQQVSEKERATAKLNALDAQIARASQAVAEARELEARRTVAALAQIQAAEEKRVAQVAALDVKAATARQARDAALGNVAGAQAGLATAAAAIPGSAAASRNLFAQGQLAAAVQEGEALAARAAAVSAAEAAAARTSTAMIALTAAINGVKAAGASLFAFLGGPWGIALTALAVGWTIYEIAQSKAKQRTEEFQKASENATSAVRALADATTNSERKQASIGANILIGTLTANMPEQLTNVAQTASSAANALSRLVPTETMRNLYELSGNLYKARDSGTETKTALQALITEVERLSELRPDLAGILGPLRELTNSVITAQQRLAQMKIDKTLADVARGVYDDVNDARLRAGTRDMDADNRRIQARISATTADQPNVDEAINKFNEAENKRRQQFSDRMEKAVIGKGEGEAAEIGAAMVQLRRDFPNRTEEELRKLAKAEYDAKDHSKGKSDEEKFEERLKRLQEQGRASFFTETDRAMIDELKTIKGDPELLKQTVDAVLAGTALPEKAQQVRNAVLLKEAGKEARNLQNQYGTLEQVMPGVRDEQGKLNMAMEKGAITSAQASQGLADYFAKLGNFKWIDQTADAIGNVAGAVAEATLGMQKWNDVAKNFEQTLIKLGIQEAIIAPIRGLIRGGLAEGVASGSNPLGFIGSAIGSMFGSTATGNTGATLPATAPLPPVRPTSFHSGGIVGGLGDVRTISALEFIGAPRLHNGLRSDEMAAVLQRGEEVVSRGDRASIADSVQAMSKMAGGGGTTVNITPPAGYEPQQSQSRTSTGTTVEVFFAQRFAHDIESNGPMAQLLSRRFGLNRMAGGGAK